MSSGLCVDTHKECSIRRLTNDESSKYISTKLGKAISIRHIERIGKQTRQQ
jgi:hypothetical protein